jgi:hypothetical protein
VLSVHCERFLVQRALFTAGDVNLTTERNNMVDAMRVEVKKAIAEQMSGHKNSIIGCDPLNIFCALLFPGRVLSSWPTLSEAFCSLFSRHY